MHFCNKDRNTNFSLYATKINVIILSLIIPLLNFESIKANANQSSVLEFEESIVITDSKMNYSDKEDCSFITCIGHIKNKSASTWEYLIFEVQYFNSSGELIDTITDKNYSLVLGPGAEASFRIRGKADKEREQYVNHKASIKWADKKIQRRTKKQPVVTKILLDWTPMIILIAVWIFFVIRMRRAPQQKDMIKILEKQVVLAEEQNRYIERLMIAIEKVAEKMNKSD